MTKIPSVMVFDKNKSHNCRFFFPQFAPLSEEKVMGAIERVVTNPDEYFKRAYLDWQEQLLFYRTLLIEGLKFRDVCERLYDAQVKADTRGKNMFIRYDMYMDLQNQVCEHMACCR